MMFGAGSALEGKRKFAFALFNARNLLGIFALIGFVLLMLAYVVAVVLSFGLFLFFPVFYLWILIDLILVVISIRHVLRSEPVRKTQIKPVRSRIPVERSNRPGCVEKPCVINKYSMCV